MSQFLALIPKLVRSRLAPTDVAQRRGRLVQDIVEGYAPFLGLDEEPTPSVTDAGADGTATVLHYRREGAAEAPAPRGDTWTLTIAQDVAAALNRSLERVGGRLRYTTPVWGRYAAVHVERWMDRATFWATVPGFEGIHWAEDDEYVYVSNRPLLPALALARGRRSAVRLSEDFTAEYLAVGYSLSGRSPFQGVHTVPVGEALVVAGGRISFEPVPPGLESPLSRDHSLDEAIDAMSSALTDATDRVVRQLAGRPLVLRLSGGKDSRLLLGLFRRHTLNLTAVTFGTGTDMDVRLARRMADMAGVPHVVTTPTVVDAENDSARIRRTLLDSCGQPPSEPHTARYRGADVVEAGHAVCLGQWPLFKGGLARVMKNSRADTRARLVGAVSGLVAPAVAAPALDFIDQWIDSTPANSQLERQYLFARSFRSGPYLQAHIAHYGGDAMLAYPFGDQEVTAVSDALTMSESVSERVFFGAMQTIWPDVMGVPLDKSVWRFEVNGPDPQLSGDLYDQRYAPVPEPSAAEVAAATGSREHASDTVGDLLRAMAGDGRLDWVMPLVTPAVAKSMRDAAAGEPLRTPQGVVEREMTKFVWRVRTADIWRSRDWIPED